MAGKPEVNLVEKLIEEDRKHPKRIFVVGDAMLDQYIQGRVEECQEGCPKFIEEEHVTVPGGAANAARSLQNWHCEVRQLYPLHMEPVKTRFMVGDKCVFRYDNDSTNLNLAHAHEEIQSTLNDWSPHAVLISDYDKGLLTPEFMRDLIQTCKVRGIICVADVKREPKLYEGSIIKGNSAYFSKEGYPEKARRMDTQAITTTGRYPPIIWDKGEVSSLVVRDQYSTRVKCINHVGAGDCFAAHLTLALASGFSLKEAAAIAHSAGRVYVQHRYNKPPELDDIRADMSNW